MGRKENASIASRILLLGYFKNVSLLFQELS